MVETEDAYKFAGQMGIQLFETSAKENVNVEEVRPGPEWGQGREWGPALPTATVLFSARLTCPEYPGGRQKTS